MSELRAWRGAGVDVEFEPQDFEIIDLALGIVPEARLCALALKWARAVHLQYPVQTVDQLVEAFPHKEFVGGGHLIDPDGIRTFVAEEYFPIRSETDLLSATYHSLVRCRHERRQA